MPSEITAFIQAQPQTQTQINPNADTQSDKENLQPGLFDAFMSEYVSPEEIITDITQSPELAPNETQLITFTGSKTFPQSVIDILAGLNENSELRQEIPAKIEGIIDTLKDTGEKIHDDIQSIIAKVKAVVSGKTGELESELPDDINGLVSQILNDESIPEETRNEIVKVIDELVNELKDSEFAGENVKNFALKLSDMIHEHGRSEKVFASVDEHDLNDTEDIDDDNNTELKDTHGNIPGYAVLQNADSVHADTVIESEQESEAESESHSELTQTNQSLQDITRGHAENQQTQNVSHESKYITHKADAKIQAENESENANHESNFDSHLEVSENENANSNQNHEQKNQSNNPSGHEEDNSHEQSQNQESGTRITSRTRNDTRRASADTSRTDDDRTDTNSRRTESRNTFQSFFEGVLSTRRNASRTSPLPLNLNTASYNFSQSSTLRDGLVNVVRFIRADGVQKANVVVDPPALGRISVELTSGTSGVEASIKVASEQIRQLVQDQLSELRMNLSQQGVQVAEFTVDVQQDNSNGNHQNNHDDGNAYRTFALNESDDDITEEFRVDLEEGLLYWVA